MVAILLKSDTFVTLVLWEQIVSHFPSGIITSLMISDIWASILPACKCHFSARWERWELPAGGSEVPVLI